jgi:hypothetical protein
MIQYTVAMSIRTVCIVLCLVVPDWWRLIPAVGAILLPYVAVVLANASNSKPATEMLRPGGLVRQVPEPRPTDVP